MIFMSITAQLEALLFFRAEPLSVGELAKLLGTDKGAIEEACAELQKNLVGRGVALVRLGNTVELRTAPDAAALVEKLVREELSRELGRAASEVLAIVLYRGQASRRDIDWVRGVNSAFTLRELAARGLVRRVAREKRGFVYEPTAELLAHLGVARAEDLPEYERARRELSEAIDETQVSTDNTSHPPHPPSKGE